MNADIAENASKVGNIVYLGVNGVEDDFWWCSNDSIPEETYKILELSREREEKSKTKIENLHSEVKYTILNIPRHLNNLIE